jgi:hypothetical protein
MAILALNISFLIKAILPLCIGRFDFQTIPIDIIVTDCAKLTLRLQFRIDMMPVVFLDKRTKYAFLIGFRHIIAASRCPALIACYGMTKNAGNPGQVRVNLVFGKDATV